jgi:ankyrin repeat protein
MLQSDILGAHLSLQHLDRLGCLNLQYRQMYRVAWPLMWRACASTCQLVAVRTLLKLAVDHSAVRHVRVLVEGGLNRSQRRGQGTKQPHELERQRLKQTLALFRPLRDCQTFLHMAVRLQSTRGSLVRFQIVKILLDAGGRALACAQRLSLSGSMAEDGMTSLHICSQGGCVLTTRELIATGGRQLLKMRTSNGDTCLHTGVSRGRMPVVQELIKAGGKNSLFSCDKISNTSLHKAAGAGRLAVVEELLSQGSRELLILQNKTGVTCLHLAAQNGHVAVVAKLIATAG